MRRQTRHPRLRLLLGAALLLATCEGTEGGGGAGLPGDGQIGTAGPNDGQPGGDRHAGGQPDNEGTPNDSRPGEDTPIEGPADDGVPGAEDSAVRETAAPPVRDSSPRESYSTVAEALTSDAADGVTSCAIVWLECAYEEHVPDQCGCMPTCRQDCMTEPEAVRLYMAEVYEYQACGHERWTEQSEAAARCGLDRGCDDWMYRQYVCNVESYRASAERALAAADCYRNETEERPAADCVNELPVHPGACDCTQGI